jgi:superoxide dismutase, Fe-Mn family
MINHIKYSYMFELPVLPYEFSALEPHIDAQTMELHHDKHHATYVTKLNAALEGQADLQSWDIESLLRKIDQVPDAIRQAVINHGGGHANHTLFWEIMTPGGNANISDELKSAIETKFESMDKFKEVFNAAATALFGSGWVFLTVTPGNGLELQSRPNQNSPMMDGGTPILGLDVWEHAYYLKYQNKRPDYIAAWWSVVNWEKVSELYAKAEK